MKEETVDQIKEFTETLDRMVKGDVSLNNKFSDMRKVNFTNIQIKNIAFNCCAILGHSKSNFHIVQYQRNNKNVW